MLPKTITAKGVEYRKVRDENRYLDGREDLPLYVRDGSTSNWSPNLEFRIAFDKGQALDPDKIEMVELKNA